MVPENSDKDVCAVSQGERDRSTMKFKGFTLIELLVVVAIIALLVSILVPSLTKARDRALTAICLHNEHQIYLGYALYANNYDGYVAPAYDFAADRTWAYFIAELVPSIFGDPAAGILFAPDDPPKVPTVVHCPAVAPHGGPVLREVNPNEYGNIREDYATNILRSGRANANWRDGVHPEYPIGGRTNFYTLEVKNESWNLYNWKQTYIGQPARTFLLVDANRIDIEVGLCIVYQDDLPRGWEFRHGGRRTTNMVFFDGHAEEISYPVGLNSWPDDPKWNTIPLEQPW